MADEKLLTEAENRIQMLMRLKAARLEEMNRNTAAAINADIASWDKQIADLDKVIAEEKAKP